MDRINMIVYIDSWSQERRVSAACPLSRDACRIRKSNKSAPV